MKYKIVFSILCSLAGWRCACAQAWPDLHLTNGTHTTSYGVEAYDPGNPVKNLHIDPAATLQAGPTGIDDIYDGNQVYLNGGTVYASAIDAPDFTWNSGNLYLNGGVHSSTYGLSEGSGKDLWLDSGSDLQQASVAPISSGNRMLLTGGKLSVAGDFDAGMDGFYVDDGATIEVGGTFTWSGAKELDSHIFRRRVILNGSGANWNCGNLEMGNISRADNINSLSVLNGALLTGQAQLSGAQVEISGQGSQWQTGSSRIGYAASSSQLLVTGGGVVSNSGCFLGYGIGAGGNSVMVSGEGSRFIASGSLLIGSRRSQGNTLSIEDGARLSCASFMMGGENETGYNNHARVEDAGSRMDVDGEIALHGTENSLSILNGAAVSSTGAIVGGERTLDYSSTRNSITVMGAGSKWINTGGLWIGGGGGQGNHADILGGAEASMQGSVNIASGGTLNLDSTSSLEFRHNLYIVGGTFNMASNRVVVGSNFSLLSSGRLNLDAGGKLVVNGTIENLGGELNFNGATLSAGAVTNFPGLNPGCRLETTSVLSDLTVHGTLANQRLGSSFSAEGALVIANDGTLEMKLGGYAPESQYDHLRVDGFSTLDGTLDLLLDSGFSPTVGTRFDLFDWNGGVSGAFATINTPELGDGLYWDTTNLYASGQISVIPEPGSVGMMGLGAGILLFTKRRRKRGSKSTAIGRAKTCACDVFDPPPAPLSPPWL